MIVIIEVCGAYKRFLNKMQRRTACNPQTLSNSDTILSNKTFPLKKAIGTSAAMGFPIAVAGTLGYLINGWNSAYQQDYLFGFIYLPAVLLISLVSYFTAPLGARLAHKLPVPVLKKVFAVFLLLLGIKMLLSII